MTLPANTPSNAPPTSAQPAISGAPVHHSIAGSVLPIQRAEELLGTLPGVVSARIVAGPGGAVEAIHVLTTHEVTPKQTVRNIESALIAHLGMRVSHKKISVATTTDEALGGGPPGRTSGSQEAVPAPAPDRPRRRVYFEDVEVRRSRTKGVACRVTLVTGDQSFVGEAEGLENERLRIELAARAALSALEQVMSADGGARTFALEGCKLVEAFDREFAFVGVTTRVGRETLLLTGSAEVRESAETSAVLAVLDATNRWMEYAKV